ncbi:hypothetical protein J5N97_000989 [Dioscorea zingiberensis]|uniref:Phytosulfokine n=1 Tax=Dioscorea zingiberensis TaxID=325984 RepID=A0A9D5BV03_9LILI|nr:hypothetical protein J5N97_000989 [Dioscorea zingiberensis]
MSKNSTAIVFMSLLLFFSFSQAIRHDPSFQSKDVENLSNSQGCEGLGEDECLERRTLVAHTDYIYTQNKPHH